MRINFILLAMILILPFASCDLFPTPSETVTIGFGDGSGQTGVNVFTPEEIFNSSAATSNSTNFWITDSLGTLSDVNSTQFQNNAGTLSIIEAWVDSLWCRLTGCTMSGDIDMDANDILDVGNLEVNDNISVGGNINVTGNIYGNGSTISDINFETVNQINKIGSPIHIDDLQEIYNHLYSAGIMHGCNLTDNGDGSINISSGYATLRESNDSHKTLYSVDVQEQNNITLTDDRTNYVYLDYNNGTPIFNVGLSINDFNCQDTCIGYIVSREGTHLDILDLREQNVDSNRKLRRKEIETSGFTHVIGGSIIGSSELNISLTAGEFYYELTKTSHASIDTSLGDTFDYYYTSDSGVTWSETHDAFEINNSYYNDPSVGLVELGNNKYKVDWIYVINNEPSHIGVLYGQEEYAKLADAEAASIPAYAPASISGLGVLVGRVILEKSAATMITESAFEQSFTATTPTTHNGLSGLDGGEIGYYGHLTSSVFTELTSWIDDVVLSDGGNLDLVNGNLTINSLLTFGLGEVVDNLVDGWIRVNGGLNVTNGLTVGGTTDLGILNAGVSTVDSFDISSGGITNAGSISGVTTLTASSQIYVSRSTEDSDAAGEFYKIINELNGGNYFAGLFSFNVNSNNHTDEGFLVASNYQVKYNGSGSSTYSTGEMRALQANGYNSGSTTMVNAAGASVGVGCLSTGNITNAKLLKIASFSPGAGTIANWYGLWITTPSVSVTTNPWAIYSSGSAKTYLNGDVSIGSVVTPGSKLHVSNTASSNDVLLLQDDSGTCEAQPTTTGLTWSCSSDAGLKTNIIPSEKLFLNYVVDMPLYDYTVVATGENVTGPVAQETLKYTSYADLVINRSYFNEELNMTEYELSVSSLPQPVLIKAIQELFLWNDIQDSRLDNLESENTMLKSELCNVNNTYSWCIGEL